MTIITYTREARCEDCIFLQRKTILKKNGDESKLKRHECTNPESYAFKHQRSKKDRACENWKLS